MHQNNITIRETTCGKNPDVFNISKRYFIIAGLHLPLKVIRPKLFERGHVSDIPTPRTLTNITGERFEGIVPPVADTRVVVSRDVMTANTIPDSPQCAALTFIHLMNSYRLKNTYLHYCNLYCTFCNLYYTLFGPRGPRGPGNFQLQRFGVFLKKYIFHIHSSFFSLARGNSFRYNREFPGPPGPRGPAYFFTCCTQIGQGGGVS